MMKRNLHIALIVVFTTAVFVLMAYIYINHRQQQLGSIEITIARSGDKGFITKKDIADKVAQIDSINYKKLSEIRLGQLEASILKNPFVEYTDAFVNIEGNLVVNVKEVVPIMRVFNRTGGSFYIDERGYFIPLHDTYTARLTVVSGYFNVSDNNINHAHISDNAYKDTYLAEAFELVKMLDAQAFLHAQISQVYLNSKNEFDLIPLLGNHIIQFGTMDDAAEKLNNLVVFYKQALLKEGWDRYETINLKYKNQVVCTKR